MLMLKTRVKSAHSYVFRDYVTVDCCCRKKAVEDVIWMT